VFSFSHFFPSFFCLRAVCSALDQLVMAPKFRDGDTVASVGCLVTSALSAS
jgi:hypothetical protein